MSCVPAYNTTIKSGGTPVSVVDEPTTEISTDNWQITDPIRRVIDSKSSVIEVYDDVTLLDPATDYTIDYLQGIITTTSSLGVLGPVTVTYDYIPLTELGTAKSYSLSIGGDVADSTTFNTGGFRTRVNTILDISMSISNYSDLSQEFFDKKSGRLPILIEVRPGNRKHVAMGWFVVETDDHAGDIAGLEEEEISLQLASRDPLNFSYFIEP